MFEKLSDAERIKRAKAKTGKVLDHFRYVLNLHANNVFVVYSDTLSSQIPTSHAANAFIVFRRSMLQFEIVRLCALWESDFADNAENILIVIELIDRASIIDALADETRSHWADAGPARLLDPSEDPEEAAIAEEALRRHNIEFGHQQAAKAKAGLLKAIADARAIKASPRLTSVLNLRNKLAHSITTTKMEEKAGPVAPVKPGDETTLLEASSLIIEALHVGVNGAGFSVQAAREINERNAEALWKGCTISVLR
jgi:hypothetical protein